MTVCAGDNLEHLVPSPTRDSAYKRLNLFLRWMVRSDEVDPGGWENVPVSKLIVPVDTHMHKIYHLLGLTKRKHADMRAVSDFWHTMDLLSPSMKAHLAFFLWSLLGTYNK
ncbi:MAG: DUF2400 family protein [Deltaproteobacteria bacterium]|nr:DUF2400 family protein [Deltaproteobacteria bacterium]